MRDIIFRGKSKDGRSWVEGGFHKHRKVVHCPLGAPDPAGHEVSDTVCLIIQDGLSDWELPVPIEGIEVLPESVGEFTGLTDLNGKKIFENDFVHPEGMNKHAYGLVRFGAYGHYDIKTDQGFFVEWLEGEDFIPGMLRADLGYWHNMVEVVGNTTDNPDLLMPWEKPEVARG